VASADVEKPTSRTYQERRLSARLLDFNNVGMVFTCRTGAKCQGARSLLWAARGSLKWKEQQDQIPCLDSQELPDWHAIVRAYAPRKLTFPGDKLKAIAALADIYEKKTEHTYIAGLWEESLVHDLCWVIDVKEGPQGTTSGHNWEPRPPEYRAPSWSWAAAEIHEDSLFYFLDEGPDSFVRRTLGMETDAVILHVDLQQPQLGSFLSRNTTYGQILSAYLIIEGFTSSANWHYNDLISSSSLTLHEYDTITTRDALEVGWSNDEVACMPVTALILTRWVDSYEADTDYYIFGLLLVEVSEHTYRRVGTFRSWSDNPPIGGFSDLTKAFQRRTLTIV
jgi:hypothetical protein